MKHKRLIVLALALLEIGLCVGMYSIVQATAATLSGLTVRIEANPSTMAETQEEQRLAVDGPVILTVDNSFGAVRIVTGASDVVAISAHKQVWASTAADAQAELSTLQLQTTKEGNAISVQPTATPPNGFTLDVIRPKVDITITVPVTTAVKGNVLRGDMTLSGTSGDAKLTANRGVIRATNIQGGLEVQSDTGDITAEHIRGQIQITSSRDTIHLTDIHTEGDLRVKTTTSDLILQDCAVHSIDVQIDRGTVNLNACTAQDVQVSAGSTDLSLGQVQASTYHLQTQRGNITVNGASGLLWARAGSGEVNITNGNRVTLDVQAQHGPISYSGSLGQGPHELTSDTGDIRLSLSPDTALTLDLQTTRGQISSQFAVTMTPGGDKNSWRGTINGGGATLKANTRNGSITLNRTNP